MTDPDRLYWDEHVRAGIEAREQRDGAQWTLGDLALSVETSYGEKSLEKYAAEVGVEYDTLVQYRWVASQLGNLTRVRNLSFSHHREVAALDDPKPWLEMAASGKWSVARLRQEIADTQREAEHLAQQETRRNVEASGFTGREAEREYARRLDERSETPIYQVAQAAVELREVMAAQNEVIREINAAYPDYDPAADSERIATLFKLFNALDGLFELDDPEGMAAAIPDYQHYRIEKMPHAIDWLTRFWNAWEQR